MCRCILLIFVYFASVFSRGSSDALEDKYLGCFRNFTNQFSMAKSSAVNQSMTIDLCIATCRRNNSTFAGLQFGGSQCMCGEDFRELVSESNCTTECSGNSSQYCGGSNRQTTAVYAVCSIGYFGIGCDRVCHCNLQAPCQRTTGACPTGCDSNWVGQACDTANASPRNADWYVGCYGDAYVTPAMDRKNPGGTTESQPNPTNFCLGVCALYNYTYIGTQYYWDCNCGDNYSRYGRSGDCSYPCSGNRSQTCGGYFTNSVYSTCPIGSFSLNCLSNCNCLNDTRCIYKNGACPAGCKPGWTGNTCSTRDCSVANDGCSGQNEICETIDLKYATKTRCACDEGFTRDKPWTDCTDIDECLDIVSACGIDAYNCTNTVGSFICGYCPKGLLVVNDTCIQPPAVKPDPRSNSQIGMIIGVVLGCLFVLLVVAIIGIVLYRRRSSFAKAGERTENSETISTNATRDGEERAIDQYSSPKETCGENECSYYNFDKKSTRIQIEFLVGVVKHFDENPGALEKEFKSVPDNIDVTSEVGKRKELKKKNRFKNILPYDHNRVILSKVGNQNFSDYINASHITGYRESDNLIAAQGPNAESVGDFWRMVLEKRVTVIVMMTNILENGKKKCEKYWPDDGEELSFGDITVRTVSEQKWSCFEQRSMFASQNSTSLELVQWHYTAWPDHGVPANIRSLLTFRKKVRDAMSSDSYTVVHCSAGAGRSGSFLAIDYLLEESETGYVDVLSCLKNLRQQRTQMIQTLAQYRFVYAAFREHFAAGDTVLRRDNYDKQLNKLRTKDPLSGKAKLEVQFQILDEQKGGSAENKTKDIRNSDATVVQGITSNVHYIVKSVSHKDSPDEFWKLFVTHKSSLALFVSKSQEEMPFVEANIKTLGFSDFDLVLGSTVEGKCITVYDLKLNQQSTYANETNPSEAHSITLLNATVSSSNRDCVDYDSLSEACAMMKSRTQAFNDPVIIASPNERIGGFCVAAFNAFDMITEENEVDIYQIVYDIRASNSRFIPTLSAYENLHDVVRQYFESTR